LQIKRICLLDNPKSGSTAHAGRVQVLLNQLEGCGFDVSCEELISLEQTQKVIEAHIESGCDLFIISGGDGTVRSVAHHLAGTRIPLLIFPAGNENLLATQLGLQQAPSKTLDIIQQGKYKDIDVAQVNGMMCIAVAGIGVDAAIVHCVHRQRKGHINKQHYVWAAIKTFLHYKHAEITIRIDGAEVYCNKAFAIIGNIPRYGGGFKLFKEAVYDDGLLDVTVFQCSNFFQLIYLFILVVVGQMDKSSLIRYYKGKSVEIVSSNSDIQSQIDGDPGPDLPLTIVMIPGGLRLLVP
jgi:diacylglycerol kinase (ATP)